MVKVAFTPARVGILAAVVVVLFSATGCHFGITKTVEYRLRGSAIQPFGFAASDGRETFGRVFCETLAHLDPTGASWGNCAQWLEDTPATVIPSEVTIPQSLGIMVVAGIFSQCFEASGLHAFQQGLDHLQDAHGIPVFSVSVSGVGSSEANAEQIETFLGQHAGDFIAVGYSKGISDLMVAINTKTLASTRIKALVSVAGTVAGSRLADLPSPAMLDGIERALRRSGLGGCDVKDAGGLGSLRREERYEFLRRWKPPSGLRSLSIVGVTSREQTSTVLHPLWDLVHLNSADQDSQVVAEEGILPGSTFLGIAKGDHWAVALPFEEAGNQLVTRNHFPRTALLEALVRMVHGL